MGFSESCFAQSTRAKIYYEVFGTGPLVIIVPGLAEIPLHYYENIPAIANAGYRVAVISLRGHAMTIADEEDCHPALFCDDILAVCESEGADRVALICESAGGWGGIRAALTNPGRVSSLLLMGSPAGVYSEQNYAVVQDAIDSIKVRPALGENGTKSSQKYEAKALLRSRLAEWASPQSHPLPFPPAFLNTMLDKNSWLTPQDMAAYNVPTLIVGGDQDAFLAAGFQRHLATLIPHSQLSDFMDAGHEPYWEQPDRFNRIVIDWLQTHFRTG